MSSENIQVMVQHCRLRLLTRTRRCPEQQDLGIYALHILPFFY